MQNLNLNAIDASWLPLVKTALAEVDSVYLNQLESCSDWLPGADNIFNSFSIPLGEIRFVLFGESPYPRSQSANGYAFWDNAVEELWAEKGLSKAVNRATSLRNFMKMLLIADGRLKPEDTSQDAIANIDKTHYVQTIGELFSNMLKSGFLLLNASLVLSGDSVRKDAAAWRPFMATLLQLLEQHRPNTQLLLFGKIAEEINRMHASGYTRLTAEHPYNISFMHNPEIITFFKPLGLLEKE